MTPPVLHPLLPVKEIRKRLLEIFPEGTPNRAYCTREIAAKTVFVMLYIGAIEGRSLYLRPDQVTRMTDSQASRVDDPSRRSWALKSLLKSTGIPGRWYAVNTREPIRDETLRQGFIRTGAAIARTDLPTTSAKPRYALTESFAALFDPNIKGNALESAISNWQNRNLSKGALARVQLMGRGAVATGAGLMITYPNGETRVVAEGPSSEIAKSVIEVFANKFLGKPAVVLLSESRNKVISRDETLAESLGLAIPVDRVLPDILLADLGPEDPLLVFIEVVASDRPISESRKESFLAITRQAGFPDKQVAFVTAYSDRSRAAFRKTVSELAWNSFAWFVSEPDHIIILRGGVRSRSSRLADLL